MSNLDQELAAQFSGPLLFDYVWWVLYEAKRRGLDRLYFLARDGYTLLRIAELFCERFGLGIECKYLYCSRASLRMPGYHLIGREETGRLLFSGGYRVTLYSILQRFLCSPDEEHELLRACGLEAVDREKLLTRVELKDIREKMISCRRFWELLDRKSREAYTDTIGYLRQEGLLDGRPVAVVDSGWTGSMQRSLRQLLASSGFEGELTGFYFGLYTVPDEEDGVYLSWYFGKKEVLRKVCFCNNLFECLLAAPHGMTAGYTLRNDSYEPQLLPIQEKMAKKIMGQADGIIRYVGQRLCETQFWDFEGVQPQFRGDAAGRISRYMAHPTKEEAMYYGGFLFCDDVSETYHLQLAAPEQAAVLNTYILPVRVFHRAFHQIPRKRVPELLWPYGTIAFLKGPARAWYRWNVYAWQYVKYLRGKS